MSSSVIVTVTVHTDPQESPDASTSEYARALELRSILRLNVSLFSSSASFVIVMSNERSAFHRPPSAENAPGNHSKVVFKNTKSVKLMALPSLHNRTILPVPEVGTGAPAPVRPISLTESGPPASPTL